MNPPQQWPPEVVKKYEAVKVLGKGGFASVVLAKRKGSQPGDDNHQVAIKVVGSRDATDFEIGYAHREVSILEELSHPCIMKLINHWEPPKKDQRCVAVLALSYARGNTLELLLKKRGAPSLSFCRIVMAQLVDAIAYMHSHGVLHRDIKPDNVVISNASTQRDEIWEEVDNEPNWGELRSKWHVVLVDFGFARALCSADFETDVGLTNTSKVIATSNKTPIVIKGSTANLDAPLDLSKSGKNLTSSRHLCHVDIDRSGRSIDRSGRSIDRSGKSIDRSDRSIGSSASGRSGRRLKHSVSRALVRKMSALGNRAYAAPEILSGVHKEAVEDTNQTLSEFVSDYGMVADAFSLGATIRYCLSGVPPHEDVEKALAAQKNPVAKMSRWIGKKVSSSKNGGKSGKQKKNLRSTHTFPLEASRLVRGLTHEHPQLRTTVRTARLYNWIDNVLEDPGSWMKTEIKFLKCGGQTMPQNINEETPMF